MDTVFYCDLFYLIAKESLMSIFELINIIVQPVMAYYSYIVMGLLWS